MDRRVNEFPWIGSHIAWDEITDSIRFDWGQSSDADAASCLKSLSIGGFKMLCAFYGTSEHSLIFETSWIANNLDLAAVNTQQYFLFGYNNASVVLDTFAELSPGRTIWGWKADGIQ